MTLDEMKSAWGESTVNTKENSYTEESFSRIVKARVRKHTGTAFQYFWASFALQILVYALLSHVIVRNWHDPLVTLPGVIGIFIFIPFTVVLMRRFKGIASTTPSGNSPASMNLYVSRHHALLESFYRFKKRYELGLIPLATFIGTFLVFELYVPGGIWAYPAGAAITFFISLASCVIAIQAENKKNFEAPLEQLRAIIEEFKAE